MAHDHRRRVPLVYRRFKSINVRARIIARFHAKEIRTTQQESKPCE